MPHVTDEQLKAYQKIRKVWEINPITRVEKSKKKYSRKIKHKGASYND